jgi:hypothetical protein
MNSSHESFHDGRRFGGDLATGHVRASICADERRVMLLRRELGGALRGSMARSRGAVLTVVTRSFQHRQPGDRATESDRAQASSADGSATTRRWDEDVQVEMLAQQVTELGTFDQPDAVVPGEPSAVVAEPGGGHEQGVVRPLVVHDACECPDVVGWHDVAIALGLDDELAAERRAAVKDDAVDTVVTRTAGYPSVLTAHGEKELTDQLLKRERIHPQEIGAAVESCRHVDSWSELVIGELEGEEGWHFLVREGMR